MTEGAEEVACDSSVPGSEQEPQQEWSDEVDEDDEGEPVDQARLQALEVSESVHTALKRLVIHGILHLGGWNDATESEREGMLRYGEKYL